MGGYLIWSDESKINPPCGGEMRRSFNWSGTMTSFCGRSCAGCSGLASGLMSEICGNQTKMFFQAPAGCSTITAPLQRLPLWKNKMNPWLHRSQIFLPYFPTRSGSNGNEKCHRAFRSDWLRSKFDQDRARRPWPFTAEPTGVVYSSYTRGTAVASRSGCKIWPNMRSENMCAASVVRSITDAISSEDFRKVFWGCCFFVAHS